MGEVVEVDFSSLRITSGMKLQIVASEKDDSGIYEGVFIGAVEDETLILTAPASGLFPSIEEGSQLTIRLLLAEGVAVLNSRVLYVTDIPMFMVFLDFPQKIKFHKIRQAKRVETHLPVLVSSLEASKGKNLDAIIIDVSLSGAALEIETNSELIGAEGSYLQIRGKFKVGSIQRLLSVKAIIRKVFNEIEIEKADMDERDSSKTMTVTCGVEFVEEKEDDLLILFGFIFNAMAEGELKTIQ